MQGFVFSQTPQEIQQLLNYIDETLPGVLQALSKAIGDETTRATNKENELLGAIGGLIPKTEKGSANGVASLNGGGQVPNDQLQWSLRGVLNPSDINKLTLTAGIYQVNGKVLGPDILDGEQANGVLLQFAWDSRVQVLYVGRAAGAAAGETVEIYTRRYLPTPKRWTAWSKAGGSEVDVAYLTPVTYAELKALRDGGELVPGMQYRITDYVTTVAQTGCSSAGHVFDIIVTADSTTTLNETARAIQREGDEYFAGQNLAAWQLKYCLDNDTSIYGWADATTGKGVIYWLRDENGNECGYDFKNVLFSEGNYTFCNKPIFTAGYQDCTLYGAKNCIVGEYYNAYDKKFYLGENFIEESFDISCGHFSQLSRGELGVGCHHNEMRKAEGLTTDVVCGRGCSFIVANRTNRFGDGCSGITLEQNCKNNRFGDGCSNITLSFSCNNNRFGDGCSNITLKNDCKNNRFGDGCSNITLYFSCYSNHFGDGCSDINPLRAIAQCLFGDNCSNITFDSLRYGGNNKNIVFQSGCHHITITGSTFNTVFEANNGYIDAIFANVVNGRHRCGTFRRGLLGAENNHIAIEDLTINQMYETVYQPADSRVVSVASPFNV